MEKANVCKGRGASFQRPHGSSGARGNQPHSPVDLAAQKVGLALAQGQGLLPASPGLAHSRISPKDQPSLELEGGLLQALKCDPSLAPQGSPWEHSLGHPYGQAACAGLVDHTAPGHTESLPASSSVPRWELVKGVLLQVVHSQGSCYSMESRV